MTTTRIAPLEPSAAPAAARALLTDVKQQTGMVPNLYKVLATAPPALEAYLSLAKLFEQSSLSGIERQAVLLAISYENSCDYCMAVHTMLATLAKTSPAAIAALRAGEDVPEERLAALVEFTRAVVRKRGVVEDIDLAAFYTAGYTQAQVLEIILGVSLKTLSNYTNHVAETPLDPAFAKFAWAKTKLAA